MPYFEFVIGNWEVSGRVPGSFRFEFIPEILPAVFVIFTEAGCDLSVEGGQGLDAELMSEVLNIASRLNLKSA